MILQLLTWGRYRTWRMYLRGWRTSWGLFRLEGNSLRKSAKKTAVLMVLGRGQKLKP